MKILFYKPHPLSIPYIKEWEEAKGIRVDISETPLHKDDSDKYKDYDGIALSVSNKFEDEVYEALKKAGIKQISVTSVGFEQIDLDEASRNDLIVTNCPKYSPESIAEFTLMMILKALKKDKQIQKQVADYDFRHNEPILGQTLSGKTVGIYGLGRIGLAVAKLVKAFGADVISYSTREKPKAEGIVTMLDSYDSMYEKADIISIHSALTDENYHAFNKETFDKMKDGAILINCARGGLVDTRAMIDALDNGKLAWAAVDVYENEGPIIPKLHPDVDDPILDEMINHPRIDFYQHIAYFTDVALKNQVQFTLDSALEVIETGDSENRVN